jgi:hypothetical protein
VQAEQAGGEAVCGFGFRYRLRYWLRARPRVGRGVVGLTDLSLPVRLIHNAVVLKIFCGFRGIVELPAGEGS